MRAVDRANRPEVDQSSAANGTVSLASRLGQWSQGSGSLTEQLADAIDQLIASGELRPGERLPSERVLASAVSVSRGTVVAAYGLLAERERVDRRQGSGTRVAGSGRPAGERGPMRGEALFVASSTAIDLLRAVPQMPDEAVEIVRRHAPVFDPVVLAEADPAGLPILRERVAQFLTEEGADTTSDQILITHGGQQGISLLVEELVSPGDVVLTEAYTWPGIADCVRRRGGILRGISLSDDGIDTDELEAAIVTHRPVLVALNPHNHNPTGTTADGHTRQRIADLAARYGVPVIEDRVLAYASLGGATPPPLAALRPDAPVIVVDSVSKWSWSGLRIGWVRADPILIRRLRALRPLVDQATSVPAQLLALDLLDAAPMLRRAVGRAHIEKLRVARELVAEHLPGWRYTVPRGGFALWLRIPDGSAEEFVRSAAVHGVAVAGTREFAVGADVDDRIRLPFTAPDPVLREGVRRLGAAWRACHSSSTA